MVKKEELIKINELIEKNIDIKETDKITPSTSKGTNNSNNANKPIKSSYIQMLSDKEKQTDSQEYIETLNKIHPKKLKTEDI